MPQFSLVIKAPNILAAEDYARLRGFTVQRIHAEMPDVHNVTLIADGSREEVERWFFSHLEPRRAPHLAGFPYGSLLLYREIEGEGARPTHRYEQRKREGHARQD